MEQNCPYDICDDSVIYVRNIIENLIEEITKEAIIEFNELNDNREKQNLRRLKRLNSWSIKKAGEKILKEIDHQSIGSQPEMIEGLGDRVLRHEDVTKSNTTDDLMEVV